MVEGIGYCENISGGVTGKAHRNTRGVGYLGDLIIIVVAERGCVLQAVVNARDAFPLSFSSVGYHGKITPGRSEGVMSRGISVLLDVSRVGTWLCYVP